MPCPPTTMAYRRYNWCIIWASSVALSVALIGGFPDSFSRVDHVDAYWVSVLWFFGLGIGAIANQLTRQRAA